MLRLLGGGNRKGAERRKQRKRTLHTGTYILLFFQFIACNQMHIRNHCEPKISNRGLSSILLLRGSDQACGRCFKAQCFVFCTKHSPFTAMGPRLGLRGRHVSLAFCFYACFSPFYVYGVVIRPAGAACKPSILLL